jgi:hypothetical protein
MGEEVGMPGNSKLEEIVILNVDTWEVSSEARGRLKDTSLCFSLVTCTRWRLGIQGLECGNWEG